MFPTTGTTITVNRNQIEMLQLQKNWLSNDFVTGNLSIMTRLIDGLELTAGK